MESNSYTPALCCLGIFEIIAKEDGGGETELNLEEEESSVRKTRKVAHVIMPVDIVIGVKIFSSIYACTVPSHLNWKSKAPSECGAIL